MNLIDRPVSTTQEDRFGHAKIAEGLAAYICDPSSDAGSVIAVTGGWGTGKSGILNLLKKQLQDRSLAFEKSPTPNFKPIFVEFEPWLVGSRDGLIAALFGHIVQKIDIIRKSKLASTDVDRRRLRIAAKRLKQSAVKFGELASMVSGAASTLDPTGTAAFATVGAQVSGGLLKKIITGERSLETERKELVEALSDVAKLRHGLRFVVLIDDLDRLESSEIIEVIRLVKAVAALPYVTYVLSFDKSIVEKAVSQALQISDGAAYLEKIIQFFLPVPALHSRHLPDFLEGYFRATFPDDADYASRRALFVFRLWAGRLLKSPRDAKRLLSSVTLMWPALRGKADLLDLLWIELLKLRASSQERDLYSWVRSYMMSVEHVSFGSSVVGAGQDAKKLREILENLGWYSYGGDESKGESIDMHHLSYFLPGVHPDYLEASSLPKVFHLSEKDWLPFSTERRLGSPRHWRYYFGFSAPDSAVSSEDLARVLAAADQDAESLVSSLQEMFERLHDQTRFPADQLLYEAVEPIIPTMSGPQAKAWLVAIVSLAKQLDSGSAATFVPNQSNFKIRNRRLFTALFQRLETRERFPLFRVLLRNPTSYWILSDFLRSQKQLHLEKDARPTDFNTENVFFEDELARAGRDLSVIFGSAVWEALEIQGDLWSVLFAWRDFDRDAASRWLRKSLESSDDVILDRLNSLITHSYSDVTTSHLPGNYLDFFCQSEIVRARLVSMTRKSSPRAERARYLLSIWQERSPGESKASTMARELTRWGWELIFDPADYVKSDETRGSKRMTFLEGGEIGVGKNSNESTWRIAGDLLEIINSAGAVFSRFRFLENGREFEHTNDDDTLSIRGQSIRISSDELR